VGQKAGARQAELFCKYRRCQGMIRSDSTESCDTLRATISGALKNVLKFAYFVTAVDRTGLIIVFYGHRSSSSRAFDRVM
jgi:hypothetical protein